MSDYKEYLDSSVRDGLLRPEMADALHGQDERARADAGNWVENAKVRREKLGAPTQEQIQVKADAYRAMKLESPDMYHGAMGTERDLLGFSKGERPGIQLTPYTISVDFANWLPEDFEKLLALIGSDQ